MGAVSDLDVAHADRGAVRPGRELVDLGLERERVRADELDEPCDCVLVGAYAGPLELHPRPGDVIRRLAVPRPADRDVEAQHVTGAGAGFGEAGVPGGVAGKRQHRPGRRGLEVDDDRLGIRLLPALDPADEHESLAATEQAERVRGSDRVLPGGGGCVELVDRPLLEPPPQPAQSERDLRQVGAGDQVDRLQLLRHGARIRQRQVRTVSAVPSLSTTTVPSRSVRYVRVPGLAASAASVERVGWP